MTDTATTTGPSRAELRERARELGIPRYGKLTKAQLADAVADADRAALLAEAGEGAGASNEGPTLEELQVRARELSVPGRSNMGKVELAGAIARAEAGITLTPGQASAAAVAANAVLADPNDIRPGTAEEVGQPDLLEVAQRRRAREPYRVIGA